MVEWPNSSCTSLAWTPLPRSRVAQVCLRSWKRISGNPALLRRGLKDLVTRSWLLIFALFQRYFVQGIAGTGMK